MAVSRMNDILVADRIAAGWVDGRLQVQLQWADGRVFAVIAMPTNEAERWFAQALALTESPPKPLSEAVN